jgi:transcriptional regulator with XRE-family HTH domain
MERLRELRRRRLLTQAELAQRVGVSLQSVQAWEWGKSEPRLRHIRRLAEVLEVPAEELLQDFEAGKAVA